MNENKYQSFTDLEVWKKGRILKYEIKELTISFPAEEEYRLTDRVIHSSRSVITNIAEGCGRFSYKDQINFCIISRGSLSETHSHLIYALDCNYITTEKLNYYKEKINEIERMLNGHISFLRSKL
jgi:four helix bundle protein